MSSFFGRRADTVTHDIQRGSNLDLLMRGFHGIANRFIDAIGGGLQAIALALSTPHDNSTEVQKQIDALTASLKPEADALEDAAKPE